MHILKLYAQHLAFRHNRNHDPLGKNEEQHLDKHQDPHTETSTLNPNLSGATSDNTSLQAVGNDDDDDDDDDDDEYDPTKPISKWNHPKGWVEGS
jgi:hypothetical protein